LAVGLYSWKAIATEVDELALENCQRIVQENGLEGEIRLILTTINAIIADLPTDLDYQVTICNPPFYDSCDASDVVAKPARSNGYEGTTTELATPGGEVAFVKQYILETWRGRKPEVWYTSMLGVKRHLDTLQVYLRTQFPGVSTCSRTLKQGQTWRWGLAWQFTV